jgi:hypothetical protein
VFCRQRQDETLRRGGEQVSVLVLASTPFSGALLPLSQAAGHAFFNEGPLALAMVSDATNQVHAMYCLSAGSRILRARFVLSY